jgi:hypothetical protein
VFFFLFQIILKVPNDSTRLSATLLVLSLKATIREDLRQMTIAKVRNLSQSGVVTDVDPFNLPPNAFSRLAPGQKADRQSLGELSMWENHHKNSRENPTLRSCNLPQGS